MVIPSGRHSAVAVDLRRVVQLAGRLIQEKVRKECPCVVSGSARCTLRNEDDVYMYFGLDADNVLRDVNQKFVVRRILSTPK